LPDKDLVDLCPPIEPYQVPKSHSVPQIVLDLFATTSTLKHKLKPSKSIKKETTKVG
jgi:hypothetical protein